MTPQPCDVFAGEDLLYFFYGKSSYRLFTDYESAITAEAPIALLLSSNILTESKRLFPFDSGGFERYRKFMPKQFQLNNFQLRPDDCAPGKVVGAFFASNLEYYDGTVRSDVSVSPDQFEAEAFLELLRYRGKDAMDDRAWTVEIQVPNVVKLDSTTVLAVALPSILLDSETGRVVTDVWGATPLTYNLTGRAKPAEYHIAIRDLIRVFLSQGGFL